MAKTNINARSRRKSRMQEIKLFLSVLCCLVVAPWLFFMNWLLCG